MRLPRTFLEKEDPFCKRVDDLVMSIGDRNLPDGIALAIWKERLQMIVEDYDEIVEFETRDL